MKSLKLLPKRLDASSVSTVALLTIAAVAAGKLASSSDSANSAPSIATEPDADQDIQPDDTPEQTLVAATVRPETEAAILTPRAQESTDQTHFSNQRVDKTALHSPTQGKFEVTSAASAEETEIARTPRSQHSDPSLSSPLKIAVTLPTDLPQPIPIDRSLKAPAINQTSEPSRQQADHRLILAAVARSMERGTIENRDTLATSRDPGQSTYPLLTDLDGHWATPYVSDLVAQGLLSGFPDGSFRPDEIVTRAQFAHVLQQAFQQAARREAPEFADVTSDHWAYQQIKAAYRMGFFPATPESASTYAIFEPDQTLSRREAWNAVVNGLASENPDFNMQLLSTWLQRIDAGSDRGSAANPANPNASATSAQLNPHQSITRAEIAVLMHVALQLTDRLPDQHLANRPGQNSANNSDERLLLTEQSKLIASNDHGNAQLHPDYPLVLVASTTSEPSLDSSIESSINEQNVLRHQDDNAESGTIAQLEVSAQLQPTVSQPERLPLDIDSAKPEITRSTESTLTVSHRSESITPEFPVAQVTLASEALQSGDQEPLVLAASQQDETYTLGPGDRVFIDIFGLPDYSRDYQVLVDGSLNLPRVGQIFVAGMTLKEAEEVIFSLYSRSYVQPVTSVILTQSRPLKVAVAGEVNRPGVYTVSLADGKFPTVTEAIQNAGGVKPDADLRQIRVRRPQPDGTIRDIQVNLWKLIQSGDLDQDITLRDGDRIVIATATEFSPTEAAQLASANFSPATIPIHVVGEVGAPGILDIPTNTPLNQAILAAGGLNEGQASRKVELIRLNPNGTVTQKQIEVDLSQGINEATNPILKPNDVIVVDRSGMAKARSTAGNIFQSIFRILPFFAFF